MLKKFTLHVNGFKNVLLVCFPVVISLHAKFGAVVIQYSVYRTVYGICLSGKCTIIFAFSRKAEGPLGKPSLSGFFSSHGVHFSSSYKGSLLLPFL